MCGPTEIQTTSRSSKVKNPIPQPFNGHISRSRLSFSLSALFLQIQTLLLSVSHFSRRIRTHLFSFPQHSLQMEAISMTASSLASPKGANPVQLQSLSTSISKVRVIVRVRPFLPHEIAAAKDGNPISCASVLDQDCDSGQEVVVYLKDQETR